MLSTSLRRGVGTSWPTTDMEERIVNVDGSAATTTSILRMGDRERQIRITVSSPRSDEPVASRCVPVRLEWAAYVGIS